MIRFFSFIILLFTVKIHACTGIMLEAKDGSIVHGRTVEFGTKLTTTVAVVPRNYVFTGTTPQGKGLIYKARYAAVGAFIFDIPALMDGLNEEGLAVGAFYFPGYAGYAKITTQNQPRALSSVEFPNWILTQFATVEEVKEALSNVVIAPTMIKEWGNTAPPFHYVVYDKTGSCLVIEPLEGKLVTYDNPGSDYKFSHI